MRIEDILKESCVVDDIKSDNKRDVIYELVGVLKDAGLIENADSAVNVILEREKLGSTGVGDGVAIPHGKMRSIRTMVCVFGRSRKGVDFDALDRKPVHFFVLLLAPEDSASMHLKMLSRISKILRDPSLRKKLAEPVNAHEIYVKLIEEDRRL